MILISIETFNLNNKNLVLSFVFKVIDFYYSGVQKPPETSIPPFVKGD